MRDNECRAIIATEGRPTLASQLDRCFRGLGAPRSVALVGLPGFLVTEQVTAAVEGVRDGQDVHHIMQLRGRDLQRKTPTEIAHSMCRVVDGSFSGVAGSLSEALTALRDRV